ncbi:MAG TPA: VWA domain-containing protein [Rudaea sp.]|nr:VWA domain-containing protein [Rudaea sp.]
MNTLIANFHFLRPWWLLALTALPLLWLAFARRGTDAGSWRAAVDAHLLPHLLIDENDGARVHAPLWLISAGWIVACLALSGPAWERVPQPLYQNRAARVIALDLSSSMSANDIKPSRFQRARFKIEDILKRSQDMQTALIAYAGAAFVVAPLTDDTNTVNNLVDALDPDIMPVDGNDTGSAIDLGVNLIRQAGLSGGQIILLTDAAGSNAITAAQRARSRGVSVSIIGVGSAQGAPVALAQGGFLKNAKGDIELPKLDAGTLRALAQAGGGSYATVSTDESDLERVLATAQSHAADHAMQTQQTTSRFLDRGPWLLLLLLPLAAFGFRRGWLMLLPLVLIVHAQPAAAFSWSDLWLRTDQRARAALDAGDARTAQALAHDPDLRGAAAYRSGDFKAATQDFSRSDSADAQYNRGNALAKQGQYEKAIAAYDAALQREHDMADALANKKAVEDWLKQQKNKQQQDKQNSRNDKKDSQDNQSRSADSGNSGEKSGDQKPSDSQQQGKKSQQQPAQNEQQKDDKHDDSKPGNPDDAGDQQNAQAQARQHEAEQQAKQQFSKSMDQALKQDDQEKSQAPKPVRLGARETNKPPDEHQQAIEQWLQRVPDDPGGLLRRKFQLEYQQRRNGGAVPGNDDQ